MQKIIDSLNELKIKKFYIVVPGKPMGKGRPKFTTIAGYPKAYTPKPTANYETLIKLAYMEKYDHIMFEVDEPLAMVIKAYMPIPKTSKKKTLEMLSGKLLPTKKPDWDNIAKIVGDALNNVGYPDDKQIVSAQIEKRYSDNPRMEVIVYSLKEDKDGRDINL